MKQRSSLWQDLYHRTGQVEADWLNGEIVRLGQAHGVPTPYSSLLQALITSGPRIGRGQAVWPSRSSVPCPPQRSATVRSKTGRESNWR